MVGILLDYYIFLSAKLLNFEIQKCGAYAHKPYFPMPGHIYSLMVFSSRKKCNLVIQALRAASLNKGNNYVESIYDRLCENLPCLICVFYALSQTKTVTKS